MLRQQQQSPPQYQFRSKNSNVSTDNASFDDDVEKLKSHPIIKTIGGLVGTVYFFLEQLIVIALYKMDQIGPLQPIASKLRALGTKVIMASMIGLLLLVCCCLPHQYDHSNRNVVSARNKSYLQKSLKMHRRLEDQMHHSNSKHLFNIHDVLLTDTEDKELEFDNKRRYHTVFSTDCTPYQHWQSFMLYYSALKVRQTGHITRIVSGCNEEEAELMMEWFYKNVAVLSNRFHIWLTPNYADSYTNATSGETPEYKLFNKPMGLKHWMENSKDLEYKSGSFVGGKNENDIIILVDPDMAFTKPITYDFSDPDRIVITDDRKKSPANDKWKVTKGHPVAQLFASVGNKWDTFDLAKITGDEKTPAISTSNGDRRLYYAAGPPFVAVMTDMHSITQKWVEFVPRVYDGYPKPLAELYAFAFAAAHLETKISIVSSLEVSDPDSTHEGWILIDKMPTSDVCGIGKDTMEKQKDHPTPHMVHLSQKYSVGTEWFYNKRLIPSDKVYDCKHPLFQEPPNSISVFYDYVWPPPAKNKTVVKRHIIKRESFMLCCGTSLLNEAATMYKSTACKTTIHEEPNLEKSKKIADLFPKHVRTVQLSTARRNERLYHPLRTDFNDTMDEPERKALDDGKKKKTTHKLTDREKAGPPKVLPPPPAKKVASKKTGNNNKKGLMGGKDATTAKKR